ncbi:MAG: peptide-methionine (S)-S-oxide reductase MsrA, partial [Phenylobacterium sp.]
MVFFRKSPDMPTAASALPGRPDPLPTAAVNFVTGQPLKGPFGEGLSVAMFAMGCFWGVERKFWQTPGVVATAVGYVNGFTPNPTYEEVCSGRTGHTEAVLVHYDPKVISYEGLLKVFWEGHDPTQGMRQGHDVGTQYRSIVLFTSPEQQAEAHRSLEGFGARLREAGFGPITTTVEPLGEYWFAEGYHQQYLSKNPGGYCGLGG